MHNPSCGSMHWKNDTLPNKRWVQLLAFALVGALALTTQAHAAWTTNGNAIVNLTSLQTAHNVVTAADGVGGIYVAWDDNRGFDRDVFVTRLTSTGAVATGWTAGGLDISPVSGDQIRPRLLVDTSGGLYVCWYTAGGDVFVQHLNSSAGFSWGSARDLGPGSTPDLTTDGGTIGGGAGVIVAYNDVVDAQYPYQVLAARVFFSGTVFVSGALVTMRAHPMTPITITSGPAGSAIVSYAVTSSAPTLFVQRFTATGPVTTLWADSVTSSTNALVPPSLASDGQSGAVLAYVDNFGGTAGGVSMARYNSTGSKLWSASPVLDSWAQGNDVPEVCSDGAGGALALWADNRTTGHIDAYAAHVNSSGATFSGWSASGELVQTDILTGSTRLIPDGAGGAFAAWAPSAAADVFVRRVWGSGCLGSVQTLSNDASSTQEEPSIALTATGAAGAVTGAWLDSRTQGQPKDGVYANQVSIADPAGTVPGVANGTFMQLVTWYGPVDDVTYGAATAFDVRQSLSPITFSNFGSASSIVLQPVTGPPGTSYCYEVDGLQSGTPYYYAIQTQYACSTPPVVGTGSGTTKTNGNITFSCNPQLRASTGQVELAIAPPVPNPADGRVSLRITIPGGQEGAALRLAIFDLAGREVRQIMSGPATPGGHALEWDLRTTDGRRVRSGVYFARLSVGSNMIKRTFIVKN